MRTGPIHRFSVDTPDANVTGAIEHAASRLAAPRTLAVSPAERAWVGLAVLAAGDHDAGRDAVSVLGEPPCAAIGSGLDEPNAEALATYLLLAARCFAWTGDHAFLLGEWPRIERALTTVARPSDADPSTAAIRVAALREIAVAAQDIGRPAEAAALARNAAREPAAAGPEIDRAVALVLDGAAPPGIAAEWLRDCARSSVLEAGERTGVAQAALRIAAFVHGVLGVEPDAARQRLAIRPRLPDEWTSLSVDRLCLGDAVVAMGYATEGDRRTFTFEQVSGAVPLRLAFEPVLPVAALGAVEVDGTAARLDARPFHGRTPTPRDMRRVGTPVIVAPVQLVLDHERTVSLTW